MLALIYIKMYNVRSLFNNYYIYRKENIMNKKLVAVITTFAITALTVVPAFAGTAEVESAKATQEARSAKLAADKENLANFQESEKAKGEAQKAASQAAADAGKAAVESFQKSELEKSEAAKEAGKAALASAQDSLNSFWSSQKEAEKKQNEDIAEAQKKATEYLSKL